jgi:glyoxylase-like metal-dependent hydrolase (beta-lactamase superfamily II)
MRISEHAYAVTGLAYSAPWCVNAGFVVGGETTLIVDTGGNDLAAATIHGYAVAVRPSNRLMVANTEKHFDHIGGNGFFRRLGVDVWGHPGIQRSELEFAAEIEEFNQAIPNRRRQALREAEAFFTGTALANPNRSLAAPCELDLGGTEVDVLATPGHTPTNLSFWLPEERVLFCGDCLTNLYLPNLDAAGVEGWREWMASLDRIEALQPAEILPGHGPVVHAGEVAGVIARVRAVLQEAIDSGRSPTA